MCQSVRFHLPLNRLSIAQPGPSALPQTPAEESSDEEEELVPEDDDFRRAMMLEAFGAEELEQMRLGPRMTNGDRLEGKEESEQARSRTSLGKRPAEVIDDHSPPAATTDPEQAKRRRTGQSLLKDEITHRNREKLGMTGPGKKLGKGKPSQATLEGFVGPSAKPPPSANISLEWTCNACTL